MYGIDGEIRAWCFDNAVMLFGRSLENELEAVEGKTSKEMETKRQRILAKWLDIPMQYKNPIATVKKSEL